MPWDSLRWLDVVSAGLRFFFGISCYTLRGWFGLQWAEEGKGGSEPQVHLCHSLVHHTHEASRNNGPSPVRRPPEPFHLLGVLHTCPSHFRRDSPPDPCGSLCIPSRCTPPRSFHGPIAMTARNTLLGLIAPTRVIIKVAVSRTLIERVCDVPTSISAFALEKPLGPDASRSDKPTRSVTTPEFTQQRHRLIKVAPFFRPARNRHYPSFSQCSQLFFVVRPSLNRWKPRQIIRVTLGDPRHQCSHLPHQEALVLHRLARYRTTQLHKPQGQSPQQSPHLLSR